jgi:hypothetical protein
MARIVWRGLERQTRQAKCPIAANLTNVNRPKRMDFENAAANATDENDLI